MVVLCSLKLAYKSRLYTYHSASFSKGVRENHYSHGYVPVGGWHEEVRLHALTSTAPSAELYCAVLKKVDRWTGKLGYGDTDSCDNHSERLQRTKIGLCLTLILA